MSLRKWFVRAVYADHNDSKSVRAALSNLLQECRPDAFILNIGAGETRLDPRVKTLEIEAAPGIDYVGSVTMLPIGDEEVDLVISQEVLEHVDDPFRAIGEIHRVLKKGGKVYLQLPFIIGYHPCPNDYWRFTDQGIFELACQAGFNVTATGMSVSAATGAYRIAVEFLAILFTVPFHRAYHWAKGAFAFLLYPMKWLDVLMGSHPEARRIAGGFFIVLQKPMDGPAPKA